MTRIPFSCFKLSLLGRHWSVPLCKFQGFDPMTPHLHPPPSVRPPCGAPDRVALLARPRPRRPAACAREVVCLSHSRVCRLPFYVPHARELFRLIRFTWRGTAEARPRCAVGSASRSRVPRRTRTSPPSSGPPREVAQVVSTSRPP